MDLISSEYGWDSEMILNLPIRRFRQIVATITERKLIKVDLDNKRALSHTKIICSFIAQTIPLEEGQKNPLLELAQQLGENTQKETKTSPVDVEAGSYERFMAAFGGKGGGIRNT